MSDTLISPTQAGDYAIEQLLHKGHQVRALVHRIDDRSQRPPLWLEAFIEKHRKAFEWDMMSLDNFIWGSLTSTHANMAWSNGSARRYANQVSPLAAVSKPTPTLFLASSDSAFVTGVELAVDGGLAQI